MNIKVLITLLTLQITSLCAFSQDKIIDNDSLLKYYLQQNPSGIDTTADAIELVRNEKFEIAQNSNSYLNPLNFHQERCYKILSKAALSLAEFSIRTPGNLKSKSFNIYVCYLENGKLVKEKITKSDALKEKLVQGINLFKFNISELKVGRILYYSYNFQAGINLNHNSTLPLDFDFESKYPVIKSSFSFTIPSYYTYKCITKNIHFDTITVEPKIEIVQNTVLVNNTKRYETTTWTAYNIERTKEEPYIKNEESTKKSLKILMDAYVIDTFRMNYVSKDFLHRTWKDNLYRTSYRHLFPQQIIIKAKDSLFNVPVLNKVDSFRNKAFKNFDDSLHYVKAVYYFVRDSIKTVYSDIGFRDIRDNEWLIQNRKGTVIEKNSLLTYLYQRMGLSGRNIILSTDEKIDIDCYDPTIINYLISTVTVGGQYYMLDPGYKFLPFGVLSPKCYNGTSFVLNTECLAIDISPESYKDRISISYTLAPTDSTNKYNLKIEEKYGDESGATERLFINRDTTENRNYFKDKINQLKYNVALKDWKIVNEKHVDSQLIIKYDMDLTMENTGAISYFNPFMRKIQPENPFKDVERKYPIEFGVTSDLYYQFKIIVPKNTLIEEYPESKEIQFKNGAVIYNQTILFDEAKNTLFLSYAFKTKEYDFPATNYGEIRNFFEQIITEQSKQIVFKKTN